jgi:hypothetical protein
MNEKPQYRTGTFVPKGVHARQGIPDEGFSQNATQFLRGNSEILFIFVR